ncbi:MAG: right-handed parallel beta-helix repeat-containing protein [Bacteroidota bacterium]
MLYKVIVSALLICFFNPALALKLYVSPQGDDRNPGSIQKPFASLSGARDYIRKLRKDKKLNETITVIVRGGNYTLSEPVYFSAEDSGTALYPITYQSEKGAVPVFSGGIKLPSFKILTNGRWSLQLHGKYKKENSPEQLFINGKRAIATRYPNQGYFSPKAVKEIAVALPGNPNADTAIIQIKLEKAQLDYFDVLSEANLKQAVVTFHHNWDITRKKIFKYVKADSSFYVTSHKMKSWNPLNTQTTICIEGVAKDLDQPGEWAIDQSGNINYWPMAGETLSNSTSYIPGIQQLIIIQGTETEKVSYINFKGLKFEMTKYAMPPGGIEPVQAAATSTAAIEINYASNIVFDNCSIAHTAQGAIWFKRGVSDSKADHCLFTDLGANAVKIGEPSISHKPEHATQHITVNNCIMQSGGRVFTSAAAMIIFQSPNNTITHNDISDFYYTGISVGWTWGYGVSLARNNNISFNHIHHLGWGVLSDMGGIYSLGKSDGTVLGNNVIHDIFSKGYGGWGLYTDEGSSGMLLENNLVYNCKSAAFHQHYGKDNIIKNNIFYNQQLAQLEASRVEPHVGFTFTNNIIVYSTGELAGINWKTANFVSDYNLYWNTNNKGIAIQGISFDQWQKNKDVNSIVADPVFANPSSGNFRIKKIPATEKIKFNAFDYTQAGVYGSLAWKKISANAVH